MDHLWLVLGGSFLSEDIYSFSTSGELASNVSLTTSPPLALLVCEGQTQTLDLRSDSLHNSCLSSFSLFMFLVYILKYFLNFIFNNFFFNYWQLWQFEICPQIL